MPAVSIDGSTHDAIVTRQRHVHARLVPFPQSGASLHVGEKERHHPRRRLVHGPRIARSPGKPRHAHPPAIPSRTDRRGPTLYFPEKISPHLSNRSHVLSGPAMKAVVSGANEPAPARLVHARDPRAFINDGRVSPRRPTGRRSPQTGRRSGSPPATRHLAARPGAPNVVGGVCPRTSGITTAGRVLYRRESGATERPAAPSGRRCVSATVRRTAVLARLVSARWRSVCGHDRRWTPNRARSRR